MKRYDCDEEESVLIDLTPLMDIVFILLIFFVVTASFIRSSGLVIDLPQAKNVKQSADPLLINLDAQGRLEWNGQIIDLDRLGLMLERFKFNQPNPNVLIRADKSARTEDLIQLIDRIKSSGIEKIAIAADSAQ